MKTIRLSRDAVKALVPGFAQKIISREVTLALAEDGKVAVEPGNVEVLRAELAERFKGDALLKADFTADDLAGARAFLYRVCHGEWPEGYEAAERLAALEHANFIRDVEIFATGTHNGDTYTEQDLDDMVSAFKELDYKPALKIGHVKDKVGSPAYGYIENLRRMGTKLLADFSSMHDSVVSAIRDKRYNRVSSEIYFNFKRGEKVFRRALKAVALLGSEVPAVAGLVPLHKVQFADETAEKLALASETQIQIEEKAFADALAERVAGLDTFLKENSVKNAAQIKALKDQHALFSADLDALKKKGTKETDADFVALKARADAMQTAIVALEQADAGDADTAKKLADLEKRNAALETEARARAVKERVASLTIPAFAPALGALFSYALANPETKVAVFSKKDGKDVEEQKSLAEVGDMLVIAINEHAKKTFRVFDDKSGRQSKPENSADEKASDALDRLANEYLVKHPELKGDYAAAFEQVCKENADLAKKYADEQNPRQAS